METVIHDLGPPAQVSALSHGCVFLYEHSVIDEFQFGFSVDYLFLRYLKFVHAWNHLDQDVLVLTFDEGGVLRGKGGKLWREQLGGGNAAQLVVASVSLTDAALRRQRGDQHLWGRYELQPLPVVLNMDENLRTGEHGLQQRIAPKYAGQHTLEMDKPMRKKKRFQKQLLQ